jgi:integrase
MCSAVGHVRFTLDSDRERGFPRKVVSALLPKADMCGSASDVRFGPEADINLVLHFQDGFVFWIKAALIIEGPLFRPVMRKGKISARRLSARAVAEIVKVYARRAGLKAADFSGHSLRSGFLTSAAAQGASIFKMMDVSRHKSIDTLRGYIRDAEMFRNHAGAKLL